MRITASRLRQDLYGILDRVLELGEPVDVVRRGKVLHIVPEGSPAPRVPGKKYRRAMSGDPEDYVHSNWVRVAGEDAIIAKAGKAAVKLAPVGKARRRVLGSAAGRIVFHEGWDAPMSGREVEEFLAGRRAWKGRGQ